MTKKPQKQEAQDDDIRPDAMERMNKALKKALETPPKPHKEERQGGSRGKSGG